MSINNKYHDRDTSWLSFNARVLQEAKDTKVPLYERIKFLAIFYSNLDEFYRIRVAEWRRLSNLPVPMKRELKENPDEILKQIESIVQMQQSDAEYILENQLLKELETHNIFIINENQLDLGQKTYLFSYFDAIIMPHIEALNITNKKRNPQLDNESIYLATKLRNSDKINKSKKISFEYYLVEVPSKRLGRFIELPPNGDTRYILFLEDVIRLNIAKIFPEHELIEAYSVKISKDAELIVEDEFSGNLLRKIKSSLNKREKGEPTRLLYDNQIPKDFLMQLKQVLRLKTVDVSPTNRYQNINDFMKFPKANNPALYYAPIVPITIPDLETNKSFFTVLKASDYLLHFPYQSYNYVLKFLEEAANDDHVLSIKITLYRVASNSKIIASLIKAAKKGKQVTAFVELKARFSEESNITHAKDLEDAGVNVLYSFPLLKVHSKLILIRRKEGKKIQGYAYLGTGNFNESTAKVYSDSSLLTAHKNITDELEDVFDILEDTRIKTPFEHILVAPEHLRHNIESMIDQEIKNALKGKKAEIWLKMNGLQDEKIINKLYEASNEGVKIRIIVRGICCLVPGIKKQSENIKVISIVDKFLEHARVYIFHNGGDTKVYLSSADFMERNLTRRIEVAFPIYDKKLKTEILDMIQMQWADNVKARIVDKNLNNDYRKESDKTQRFQTDFYTYLEEKYKK